MGFRCVFVGTWRPGSCQLSRQTAQRDVTREVRSRKWNVGSLRRADDQEILMISSLTPAAQSHRLMLGIVSLSPSLRFPLSLSPPLLYHVSRVQRLTIPWKREVRCCSILTHTLHALPTRVRIDDMQGTSDQRERRRSASLACAEIGSAAAIESRTLVDTR